jgi:hypothetical protein
MTAEQSLVGAMGCASWRSHYGLREYATLAEVARTIRGDTSPHIASVAVNGLNEVGITDTALAAIWRFGPRAAAYAISSHAEARHLGADVAIAHLPTLRILLYQAKLASHLDGSFVMKSPVTRQQLGLLRRRRPIEIEGTWYQLTGRLALYQQDLTPFLGHYPPPFWPDLWWEPWQGGPGPVHRPDHPGEEWGHAPEIGRRYYERILVPDRGSPSGILAAVIPNGNDRVTSVAEASTWPWEFDTYQWLRQLGPSNGNGGPQAAASYSGFGGAAPAFEPYLPTVPTPQAQNQAAGIARGLAERLRLPASVQLHVIALP